MTYADERYEEGIFEGRAEERTKGRAEIIANLKKRIIEKRQNGESSSAIKNFIKEFESVTGIDSKTVEELIE